MPPKSYAWRSQNDPFPADLQDLEGVSRGQLFGFEWGFLIFCFVVGFLFFFFKWVLAGKIANACMNCLCLGFYITTVEGKSPSE